MLVLIINETASAWLKNDNNGGNNGNSNSLYLPSIMRGWDTQNCYLWEEQIPLQEAVNQNNCVLIQAGTWTITEQIELSANHRLIGSGMSNTTLQAVEPWAGNGTGNGSEAVVHNNGNENVLVANFTVDANDVSTFGLGSSGTNIENGMSISHMAVRQAKCDGIAIAGNGVMIQDSVIEENGLDCLGFPAAGIYAIKTTMDTLPAYYHPVIVGNVIRNNNGPGVDVDRVWGGVFSNNIVEDNQAWAAVSIYAAGHWLIENNVISHPSDANPTHLGHPMCMGGSSGNYSAAISICQDTGAKDEQAIYHSIRNNQITGWYGIRLIGNDETQPDWVPRFTTVENNDVFGSVVGCADDYEPSQGSGGDNAWLNNNCRGKLDTPPHYF